MKKAALAVAIVVLALVGLVFLLPFAVNSGTLRTALAHQLSEAAAAEIALNGPIHFSVFPDFGVVVEDFAYRATDGAVSVSAARSVASVAPLSLLSSQVRITGIELQSPRIILADAADPASQQQPAAPEEGDIFKLIAGYLERLSIDHIVVTDGEVAKAGATATEPVASDIDLRLSVPGIAEPASLTASAISNGNRLEVAAEIGSLRDLLARQPARFSLASRASEPPHPALAEITASGSIQLADDGSYRITGGEIASVGQKMQLDASYVPGARPFVVARIKAGTLAYADFQPQATETIAGEAPPAGSSADAVDLSALQAFDADVELYAEALQVGDATARDVVVAAQLKEGRLLSTFDSTDIAGGRALASLAVDASVVPAVSSGSLNLTAIDIEELVALAGQQAPVSGRLSSELQYAFKGMEVAAIRNSLNLRGTLAIAGGKLAVPQLASVAGAGAGVVEALEASVRLEDVRQPLVLSGTAHWNGEPLSFSTSLALADWLWGQPGQVALDLRAAPVNASFAGTLSLDGALSGKADIAAPSLTRAAGWLGQTLGTPLGRFSFSGGVAADSGQVAVTEASIGLDDIRLGGSLAVTLSGKPKVTAALRVDTLDFGALTGGGEDGSGGGSSAGSTKIDLAVLRLFDADIRLEANQLGYGAVKAGPATASLSVADGVAKLSLPQAGFYGGSLSANVTADGSGAVPAIALAAGMEGVQALPLLTDAAGFQNLEGTLKANMELAGAGADSQAFARSLRGPVALVFNDGAIRGIDVAGLVRNVQSLLVTGYSADSEARTEFTELSAAMDIEEGVGTVRDIRLLGPFVRMSGTGSIDLAAQTIDMRLDPRVVGSLDGQGGDFDVSGLGMPIIVNGPLARPSIYPDISGILADPNRALQALSGLGGGVGELASGASGMIDNLGGAIGGEIDALGNDTLTNALGQIIGGQGQSSTDGAASSGPALLNSVLGNVLGQQAQEPPALTDAPAQQAAPIAENGPVQAENIALPRPDPRGPTIAPPPQPAPPTQTEQVIDLLAPQLLPETGEGENDPLGGLLNQLGM